MSKENAGEMLETKEGASETTTAPPTTVAEVTGGIDIEVDTGSLLIS